MCTDKVKIQTGVGHPRIVGICFLIPYRWRKSAVKTRQGFHIDFQKCILKIRQFFIPYYSRKVCSLSFLNFYFSHIQGSFVIIFLDGRIDGVCYENSEHIWRANSLRAAASIVNLPPDQNCDPSKKSNEKLSTLMLKTKCHVGFLREFGAYSVYSFSYCYLVLELVAYNSTETSFRILLIY